MLGTYINVFTVMAGSLVGLILRKRLREEIHDIIYTSIGIISIALGLSLLLRSSNMVYIVLALIIGGCIGLWLKIEERIIMLGEGLWKLSVRVFPRVAANEQSKRFAYSFLDSSILFCSGSLAILGPISAVLQGDYTILMIKSVLDGVIAIMFAAASGLGVFFSALSILAYQGAITLLAGFMNNADNEQLIRELGATGGVLVIFIGVRLWNIRKIPIGNYLPALIIIVFLLLLDPIIASISTSLGITSISP